MKILVIPELYRVPMSDTIYLIHEMMNQGHEVTVAMEAPRHQRHLEIMFDNKEWKKPEIVLRDSKIYPKKLKKADLIFTEKKKDKPAVSKREVSLEELNWQYPACKPVYDIFGTNPVDSYYAGLMRDGLRLNNEKIYYIQLTARNPEGSKPEDYAGASYMAVRLMELDALLNEQEIAFFEVPVAYEDVISNRSFNRIKPVFRKYIPWDLMNICDALITDFDPVGQGYQALKRKPVIYWNYDEGQTALNVVDQLRNKQDVLIHEGNFTTHGNTKFLLKKLMD